MSNLFSGPDSTGGDNLTDRPTWQKIADPGNFLGQYGVFGGDTINNANKDSARAGLTQGAQGAYGQAGQAGDFANQAQGNYGQQTQNLAGQTKYLQDLQSGKNSVAAEQLRQGLQQNVAAQRSMAQGGAPQNSAMMARNAMNNSAALGYGMSGQQAVAGLQERNAATNALTNAYLGQRGQDLQGALGSRSNAIQGYGTGAQAYGTQLNGAPDKSWLEKNGPLLQGLGAGMMASDERLKTDVKDDGDAALDKMTKSLKAYTYRYKDPKFGKGEQFGVMAQELEKAGLKHAVVETPVGKMVHGAKLSTANTAMIASLGRKVAALEAAKK